MADRFFFLDIEASSLDDSSFPIEIAWVDATGQGESYLIQPEWNWTNWSDTAQSLHGISRARLRKGGKSAAWVAERVWTALNGATICSDNPAYDAHWLTMLLAVKGFDALPVIDLVGVLGREVRRVLSLIEVDENTPEWHRRSKAYLDAGQIYSARQIEVEGRRPRIRHRALPDAKAMWWCWWMVKEWVDRRLEKGGPKAAPP